LVLLICASLLSCEVTPEKIELWKGTQNGPVKIAAALADANAAVDIRAQSAVALVQIGRWQMLDKSFKALSDQDRQKISDAMIEMLKKNLGDVSRPGAPKKSQVDSKDAIMFIYDWLSPEKKTVAETLLNQWITGDFNTRFLAGNHSIKKIVHKIGKSSTKALALMIKADLIVLEQVCQLIKEEGDAESKVLASQKLAEILKEKGKDSTDLHFKAASIIGEKPLQEQLLSMASSEDLPESTKRFALRAYSKNPNADDVDKLFAIAGNSKNDRFHREESYYAIAELGRKKDLPRLMQLLKSRDPFYRGVGFKVSLKVGGPENLVKILSYIGSSGTKWNWKDLDEFVIDRICRHKPDFLAPMLDELRKALDHQSAFVRAAAVHVLGRKGNKNDLERLNKMLKDKGKIKGFSESTVGAAAKKAAAALSKNT